MAERDVAGILEGGPFTEAGKRGVHLDAAETEERLCFFARREDAVLPALGGAAADHALGGSQHVGVVSTAQPAVSHDGQHGDAPRSVGDSDDAPGGVPGIGSRFGQHLGDAAQIRGRPGDAPLCPHDLGGGDELHGARDLLRGLHALDAPPNDAFLTARHG